MKIIHRKYRSIGRFLKEKREAVGLAQNDVRELLGYSSPQLISDWERGICGPPTASLAKLARIYRISWKSIVDQILLAERMELESLLGVRSRKKEISA